MAKSRSKAKSRKKRSKITTPKERKDVFTVCKKNVDKFFSVIEKSPPRYQQSVAKLQQDYLQAWKALINSAIALEQEFVTKAGMRVDVPPATLKTIDDITQQAIEAYAAQNKIVENAQASAQTFNTFNENTKSLASLNRNIMESMMLALQKPKT